MAFVEESAVAKGIRRIVGITGAPAMAAQGLGIRLEQRAAHLQAELAERGVDPALDAALSQLRYLLRLGAVWFQRVHYYRQMKSTDILTSLAIIIDKS